MSDFDLVSLIIEKVAEPVERNSKSGRQGAGVYLGSHEAALRRLLSEAHEIYRVALDDWETRRDPHKPGEHLERNWDPDEKVPYDYGAHAGKGLEDWNEFWKRRFYRGRGNPGRGRTRDLPVEPLHPMYVLVRRWWLRHVDSSGFRPNYRRDWSAGESGPRSNLALFNPAGRLLLLVAQEMDPRYTPYICSGLYETRKKRRLRKRRSE